jgi:hypothetical protein
VPYTVVYEDLIASYEETVRAVLEFLRMSRMGSQGRMSADRHDRLSSNFPSTVTTVHRHEFRKMHIPSGANLRDIGGYRTRGGATIASGRVYRGAELCALDPGISTHLVEVLGIERIIDLRMDGEVGDGDTSRLPPRCERVHLPLFSEVPSHWAEPSDRTPVSTARRYFEMAQVGRETLGRIVEMLAELPPRPTLIHCVAGRDRTGIVVASLLDVLDVPEEVIAADYALSGVMDDAEGRNADPANIVRLLELIRAEYGSTREMLLDTGASEDSLDGLGAALLAS